MKVNWLVVSLTLVSGTAPIATLRHMLVVSEVHK